MPCYDVENMRLEESDFMIWRLQAITDELTGSEILIEGDMLVGRHQSADLLLQSAEISRKHAAFLVKQDALWVQDLGSSNGTFVNDVRIVDETLLHIGDVVQFANLKFSVLAAASIQPQSTVIEASETVLSETQTTESTVAEETAVLPEKTAAEKMNEQGMPELKERDAEVQLSRDGMPQGISVPKPAPIPEGIDIHAVHVEPKPVAVEPTVSRVEQEVQTQKNASLGLITIIVLIIVAFIAWILFGK